MSLLLRLPDNVLNEIMWHCFNVGHDAIKRARQQDGRFWWWHHDADMLNAHRTYAIYEDELAWLMRISNSIGHTLPWLCLICGDMNKCQAITYCDGYKVDIQANIHKLIDVISDARWAKYG
jgi:hypothetical protein